MFKKHKQRNTEYVHLDTNKCEACWKCIDICPNNVIGRINLPLHKHVRITDETNCIGCFKCVEVCEFQAISII